MDDVGPIAKEDVINMLLKRQRLWLDASVVIANMLPITWEVIEGYLAETQNLTNLLLTDLIYDSTTELLRYSVFEQGDSMVFHVPVPLSLAIDPGENGERLIQYFQTLQSPSAEREVSNTPESKIRSLLKYTQNQHPEMYMNIDRLTEVELQLQTGELFKHPLVDKLQ